MLCRKPPASFAAKSARFCPSRSARRKSGRSFLRRKFWTIGHHCFARCPRWRALGATVANMGKLVQERTAANENIVAFDCFWVSAESRAASRFGRKGSKLF